MNCPKLCGHFTYHSFFASGSNRKAISGGTAEFTTFHFYEIPMVLREMLHPRVTILSVSPPDENGNIAQKTEDLVGPYELHDFFLYYMLRCGFEPEKIFRIAEAAFIGQYDKETILKWLKIFYRRFFSQQFKRSCLPDGPKVGSVAVSPRGDLRMPSDACGRIWMEQLDRIALNSGAED